MARPKKDDLISAVDEKFKASPLWDLPSMDGEIIEKLDAIGVHTLEILARTPPKDLEEEGISELKAAKLNNQAREKIGEMKLITGADISQYSMLPTGCKALDDLLGGGYMAGELTEICGLWGIGKSQACMTAAVMAWKEWQAPAIYVHTETHQNFDANYIKNIADARGINYDVKNLYYILAEISAEQLWAIRSMDIYIKQTGAKLLILDSIGAHLRSEYPGQGRLAARQQILSGHLRQMARLAKAFGLVVLITNGVHSDPAGSSQVPTLGNIMHTNVGKIILIRNTTSAGKGSMYIKGVADVGMREAVLLKALGKPVGSALLKISDKGITDIE